MPLDPARKLSDLSDHELAKLLNMTAPEVRDWKLAREHVGRLEETATPEAKKTSEEDERTYERFWNLSVEEFEQSREGNAFSLANQFVRPAPEDAAGRFRALQDLLREESEFETRYPAAFEVLYAEFAQSRDRTGLLLPSFDVRILNNWVLPQVQKQTEGSGADACTLVTAWQKDSPGYSAGPQTGSLQYDDLQGVLLAILTREESWRRSLIPRLLVGGLTPVEGVEMPKPSSIGITDLRLVGLLAPGVLERGLRNLLDQLHRPITPEHVVLWKLRLLGSELEGAYRSSETVARHLVKIPKGEIPEDALDYIEQVTQPHTGSWRFMRYSRPLRIQSALLKWHFGDEDEGITAVSFAAAALWLFLDLDMGGVRHAKFFRLAEQIEALAAVLRKLSQGLQQATTDLGELAANRAAGRQPEPPRNNYLALHNYRLGFRDLRSTAEWLGITPYSSRTGKGTRDWKARVRNRLRKGLAFEEEHYPRAAAIFANRDNSHVRRRARRTYRKFIVEIRRNGYCHPAVLGYFAGAGGAQKQRGREVALAYLQLGSCILRKIPPIP